MHSFSAHMTDASSINEPIQAKVDRCTMRTKYYLRKTVQLYSFIREMTRRKHVIRASHTGFIDDNEREALERLKARHHRRSSRVYVKVSMTIGR